jgi:DNA polymerase alpha subunit A
MCGSFPFVPTPFSAKSKSNSKKVAKPAPKAPAPLPSMNAYRPAISEEKEKEMLESIMSAITDAAERVPQSPPRLPRKRKSSPLMSSSPYHDSSSAHDPSSDGPDSFFDDIVPDGRSKRQRTSSGGTEPGLDQFNELAVKEEDDEYDVFFGDDLGNEVLMEVDATAKTEPKKFEYKTENSSENKPLKLPDAQPAWLALHSALKTADEDTIGVALKHVHSTVTPENVLESNGAFHFYWLDYLELDGKVYLTGKTRNKQQGTWLSCCVIVEKIERNLFVFPRSKIHRIGFSSVNHLISVSHRR